MTTFNVTNLVTAILVGIGLLPVGADLAWAQQKQPNIVIIWGDDIGQSNISAYSMGLMGYRTPNIDSIAQAGMIFTDYYAEQSCTAGRASFKVHLDGYNLVPYLTGQTDDSPRESFIYCNDDQQVTGLRYDNWKFVFMEQRARGTLLIWAEPFTTLRVPKIFNLRTDPYERADVTSNTYYDWLIDHVFLLVPAQEYIGKFLMTFKEFPQRQKAASFNLDEVMEKLRTSGGSK